MSKKVEINEAYKKAFSDFLVCLAKEKPEPLSEWEIAFATRGFQHGWRSCGILCLAEIKNA